MSGVFEEKYFCAVNSGTGFISYYGELMKKAERIFIIKGGPGTGKSSFMRQIARRAQKCGKNVKYYYCSSDPDSLDAVLTDDKTLFLDGTAPHSVDTSIPGARDNIIDLGAFWDSAALIGQRNRIQRFAYKKKTAFECAYHYLASARESSLANEKLLSSALLTEKINGAAERCLSAIPKGKAFRKNVTVTNSFGMKGKVGFDTLSTLASERISVPDKYGSAHLFLGDLIRAAEKKELSITVSLDPLIPCRADAVLLNATGKLYFIGSGGEKNINMLRFLDAYTLREIRSDLRRAQELTLSSVSAALCSFENAAEHHFALEKIYGEAMDFAAKEEFTDNFIAEMFE